MTPTAYYTGRGQRSAGAGRAPRAPARAGRAAGLRGLAAAGVAANDGHVAGRQRGQQVVPDRHDRQRRALGLPGGALGRGAPGAQSLPHTHALLRARP